jgi:hypothetical protein
VAIQSYRVRQTSAEAAERRPARSALGRNRGAPHPAVTVADAIERGVSWNKFAEYLSQTATLPPARRSPMIPEPTTAASRAFEANTPHGGGRRLSVRAVKTAGYANVRPAASSATRRPADPAPEETDAKIMTSGRARPSLS